MGELVGGHLLTARHAHQLVDVLRVAGGQLRQDRVRGQGVLEVGEGEELVLAVEDVAEVVGVGAVGEHVGDLEHLAGLGVGVAPPTATNSSGGVYDEADEAL